MLRNNDNIRKSIFRILRGSLYALCGILFGLFTFFSIRSAYIEISNESTDFWITNGIGTAIGAFILMSILSGNKGNEAKDEHEELEPEYDTAVDSTDNSK